MKNFRFLQRIILAILMCALCLSFAGTSVYAEKGSGAALYATGPTSLTDVDSNGTPSTHLKWRIIEYPASIVRNPNNHAPLVDIRGVSSSSTINTSYENNGYAFVVQYKENANADYIYAPAYDVDDYCVYDDEGNLIIKYLEPKVIFTNNGKYAKVIYSFQNVSGAPLPVRAGVHLDVQINEADNAPLDLLRTSSRSAMGFKMTENSSATAAQFNLYFSSTGGLGDSIQTYWFGKYPEHKNNVFNAVDSDKNNISDIDSALAFSWKPSTLEVGEIAEYSFMVGVGTSANPPEWKIPLNLDISAAAESNQIIKVNGKAQDAVGSEITLYYNKNGKDEKALVTKTIPSSPSEPEITFDESIDYSTWPAGVYELEFWLTNKEGSASESVSKTITINPDRKVSEGNTYNLKLEIGNPLIWDQNTSSIPVPGEIDDGYGTTDTLYYRVATAPNGSTGLPSGDVKLGNDIPISAGHASFSQRLDTTDWPAGSYTLEFYTINDQNLQSNTVQRLVTVGDSVTPPNPSNPTIPGSGGNQQPSDGSGSEIWYGEPEEIALPAPNPLPTTGDSSMPAFFFALMLLSGFALVLFSRKRSHG